MKQRVIGFFYSQQFIVGVNIGVLLRLIMEGHVV